MAYPWDAYRSSVCPRYHTDTRAYPLLSGPWQIAPRAHPLSFFPVQTRLSYISCSTPEFQTRLFTLSFLKGSLPIPPFVPLPPFPAPEFRSSPRHAWDHVSLSINDFYGLLFWNFFFSFFPTKTFSWERRERRETKIQYRDAPSGCNARRSCTCRSRHGRD
jgi:hypothetical protein